MFTAADLKDPDAPARRLRVRDDLLTELHRAFGSCPVVSQHNFDENLILLGDTMGGLARTAGSGHNVEHRLLSIAAFAMQWSRVALGAINQGSEASFRYALEDVRKERQRQGALFVAGKLSFDCASPVVDARRKYRVLLEEVGEVAQAVDQLELKPGNGILRAHLAEELIQVAAVAVAWLEALEARTQ